jgi:thiamine biosynthesis protein ThiI
MGIRLATVPFTAVQLRIKERSPEAWTTILLRMAMMECADRIARMQKDKCLITGESLSQVASQTVENIQCTGQNVKLPVFRPLIGSDKNETIDLAKKIGTYATSILPYADCCSLFSPIHPMLKGSPAEAQELYSSLELEDLMAEAIRNRTLERCGFPG